MPVKDRFDLPDLKELLKHSRTLPKHPRQGLAQVIDDFRFDLGAHLADYSLTHPDASPSAYVLPIAFYLETSDPKLIQAADRFWKTALAETGFTVLAEREIRGSFLKILFARTRRDKKERKKQLSRLEKKTVEFVKKFEKVVKVVALGTIFMGGSPTPPNLPPTQPPVIERRYELPAQDAQKPWQDTFQKFKEKVHTAEEGAGGILAAIELARKKNKKKDKSDKDD